MITLRPVCDQDEEFLRALYASTRREEVAAWGWPAAQVEAFLAMQFGAQRGSYAAAYPNARHDVIVKDDERVGRFYVWRGKSEWRVVDISLLPTARGQGIGSMLLRRLMDEAAGERLPVRLQVVPTNPARRLYLRLGFRFTRGDGMYDEMEWSADAPPREP